jgi:hypothetical protein
MFVSISALCVTVHEAVVVSRGEKPYSWTLTDMAPSRLPLRPNDSLKLDVSTVIAFKQHETDIRAIGATV